MRTDYQVGDRFELVVEKLPGETESCHYICNGVEIPKSILDHSPRRTSTFPLEENDVISIEGRGPCFVSKIIDGDIHLIFQDGTVGVSPAGYDLIYTPEPYMTTGDVMMGETID